jgi:hypothetical protein
MQLDLGIWRNSRVAVRERAVGYHVSGHPSGAESAAAFMAVSASAHRVGWRTAITRRVIGEAINERKWLRSLVQSFAKSGTTEWRIKRTTRLRLWPPSLDMKIADEVMRGPSRSQYRDADWNKICLDNEWDVRTQERLSASCYESRSWWRWLGRWIDVNSTIGEKFGIKRFAIPAAGLSDDQRQTWVRAGVGAFPPSRHARGKTLQHR